MNIYTYVVDHGNTAPAVGVNTEVNGGRVIGVCFDDALLKMETLEDLLREAAEELDPFDHKILLAKINNKL